MATEKKTILEDTGIILPKQVIFVKVANIARAPFEGKGHYKDEAVQMSGTPISLSLPSSEFENGRGFDIFSMHYNGDYNKGDKLRMYLESRMGIATGGLSVNDIYKDVRNFAEDNGESYFWRKKESKITVVKTGASLNTAVLKLDLSVPADFLKYLILKVHPKCAKDENSVGKEHILYLYDPDKVKEAQKSRTEKLFSVIDKLAQMRRDGSKLELYIIYRLLFRKNNEYTPSVKIDPLSYTIDDVTSELTRATEKQSSLNTLYTLFEELDDITLGNMTLLQKGLEASLLKIKGTSYFTKDNILLGNTIEAASASLAKPEFSELVLVIIKAYESLKK
jgi:hypothetical protein